MSTIPGDRHATAGKAVTALLKIGLIAGTLDISDALIWNLFHGIMPVRVFQHIASGLLGAHAFGLGARAVALGIVLHYLIALIWTAVFYVLSRKLSVLHRRPLISGLLYGVLVYVVMNFVVLPLSALPHSPRQPTLSSRVNGVLALMFCIGLTVSLLLSHFRSKAIRSEALP